ncbi:MAG TPA: hypothetical protein RMH99_23710 [Sandaracinaceae bacterium LLY-WYZ-13_1]|nr:hypothetical protein [Sandaracinaceae bacterium LLY-WYZ-13_1]
MLRNFRMAFSFLVALTALGCANEVGNDGDRVGGACVVSGECYIDSRCLTTTEWPGGYCAQSCDSDEGCPDGSVCTEEEGGICVVSCAGDTECRSEEGYTCMELEARGAGGTVMGCAFAE